MSSRPGGWAPRGSSGQPYWEAKFPGECQECKHSIKVGEEIMRAWPGGYVHVTCPTTKPTKFTGTDNKSMGF